MSVLTSPDGVVVDVDEVAEGAVVLVVLVPVPLGVVSGVVDVPPVEGRSCAPSRVVTLVGPSRSLSACCSVSRMMILLSPLSPAVTITFLSSGTGRPDALTYNGRT